MPTDATNPLGLDEAFFRAILADLIDENPMACRAALSLAGVSFTTKVPTLAVTLSKPVLLRVNLDFVARHCHSEEEVKAVLLHEFLHILLGHTQRFDEMNQALNVALDTVINAIIHRRMGDAYSAFFSRYYAEAEGVVRMLRPMNDSERLREYATIPWGGRPAGMLHSEFTLARAWFKTYEGTLAADDVLAVAETLHDDMNWGRAGPPLFLGGHEPGKVEVDDSVSDALDETLRQIDGTGIWRSALTPGSAQPPAALHHSGRDERKELWERTAMDALRKALLPDRAGAPTETRSSDVLLPVLSPVDRRAFLGAMWSPIIPNARWPIDEAAAKASAHVYLDVSGSMAGEMDALIGLLRRLLPWVKRPFWAFSTEVAPADIQDGQLVTTTRGGTDLDPVLRHIVETRAPRALVITDGFVGRCDEDLLAAASSRQIHVLISRQGSSRAIETAGLPFTQLDPWVTGDDNRLPEQPWGVAPPPPKGRARPRAGLVVAGRAQARGVKPAEVAP